MSMEFDMSIRVLATEPAQTAACDAVERIFGGRNSPADTQGWKYGHYECELPMRRYDLDAVGDMARAASEAAPEAYILADWSVFMISYAETGFFFCHAGKVTHQECHYTMPPDDATEMPGEAEAIDADAEQRCHEADGGQS